MTTTQQLAPVSGIGTVIPETQGTTGLGASATITLSGMQSWDYGFKAPVELLRVNMMHAASERKTLANHVAMASKQIAELDAAVKYLDPEGIAKAAGDAKEKAEQAAVASEAASLRAQQAAESSEFTPLMKEIADLRASKAELAAELASVKEAKARLDGVEARLKEVEARCACSVM